MLSDWNSREEKYIPGNRKRDALVREIDEEPGISVEPFF